jgi:ribose transport system substrate-binding protein
LHTQICGDAIRGALLLAGLEKIPVTGDQGLPSVCAHLRKSCRLNVEKVYR